MKDVPLPLKELIMGEEHEEPDIQADNPAQRSTLQLWDPRTLYTLSEPQCHHPNEVNNILFLCHPLQLPTFYGPLPASQIHQHSCFRPFTSPFLLFCLPGMLLCQILKNIYATQHLAWFQAQQKMNTYFLNE